MKRRQILVTFATSAAVVAASPLGLLPQIAWAEDAPVHPNDRILGNADAPVTIIEYASLTCPHCANFHNNTLPAIKKNWIETGKAKLVYRDYPLDGLALRAAVLASCLEGDAYFAFLDVLFRSQQQWARSNDPVGALAGLARLAGMDEATIQACSTDEAAMNNILALQKEANDSYEIRSTPSFIVNGKKVEGALNATQFESILKDAES